MAARDLAHGTPRPLSRAEYDRMVALGFFHEERLELIHGTLLRMSPIGADHADAVDRLMELFVLRLAGRARVRIQHPLAASDDSEPEPDVAVVPLGDYSKEHPGRALLVIEVAVSSLAYDRETKGALYAASGVPEYWIVDVVGRAIEVHTEPDGARYAQVRRVAIGERVSPASFPEIAIGPGDVLA
jgi:Uma2 family endonuclease